MSQRAKDLAARFEAFNNDLIAFVENCSEENWRRVCSGEQWPVGVVARHIAAGHYGALDMAKMIVTGRKLPELSQEVIDRMNAKHAKQHADCRKDEVLRILRENGTSIFDYVAGLTDADLDCTGQLALAGGTITTEQFIASIIINAGAEHFANMRAAAGA